MTRRSALVTALLVAMAAATPLPAAKPPRAWQSVASAADRDRLARLWQAWTHALAEVDAGGQMPTLAALGPVAVADAATMNADSASDRMASPARGPLPGPGTYRCRTINLGTKGPNRAAVLKIGADVGCRIDLEGETLRLEIEGSANRLGGQLFADGDRMVFLGATAMRGEMGIMPYRADPERDAIGALRALGPGQWRLELPWPTWQSTLDLVEITRP